MRAGIVSRWANQTHDVRVHTAIVDESGCVSESCTALLLRLKPANLVLVGETPLSYICVTPPPLSYIHGTPPPLSYICVTPPPL
eukprot:7365071-Pyramimonas_sp.AAC.1